MLKISKHIFLVLLIGLTCNTTIGQISLDYSDTLNKKRRNWVWGTEIVGATSSILLLNEIWYKNHPRAPLHSFNDNAEWLQMDKFGHGMTSYYIGIVGIETLKWSGVNSKKSALIGGSLGLMYLSGVEILDGTSAAWGFSWGDMLANTGGFLLAGGQELLWQKQKIKLKVSSHLTTYSFYRPNVLGSTTMERLLKDYNGQTYWLSLNIKSLFFSGHKKFPSWINMAYGIGAEGLISGTKDADFCKANPSLCNAIDRYRQFYISFDIDLTQIEWKRKIFKTLFGTIGWIKIPAPTLEFGNGKIKGYWLYF